MYLHALEALLDGAAAPPGGQNASAQNCKVPYYRIKLMVGHDRYLLLVARVASHTHSARATVIQ
jgi:hypothetical protein